MFIQAKTLVVIGHPQKTPLDSRRSAILGRFLSLSLN